MIITASLTKAEEVGADSKSNTDLELEARIEAERKKMEHLLLTKEFGVPTVMVLVLGGCASRDIDFKSKN